jgi:hypothetical protein
MSVEEIPFASNVLTPALHVLGGQPRAGRSISALEGRTVNRRGFQPTGTGVAYPTVQSDPERVVQQEYPRMALVGPIQGPTTYIYCLLP